MADANRRSLCNFGHSKSNLFVTIKDVDTSYYGLSNWFHCKVEPIKIRHGAVPCELSQPKFSSRNPFINYEGDSYCFQRGVANRQSDSCSHMHNHQPHAQPAAIAMPHSNPFSSAQESCIHSTPRSVALWTFTGARSQSDCQVKGLFFQK